MASRCTRRGELVGSGRVVVFAICFAWNFERSPLGSVSEVLNPLMYAVKMNDDGSIRPLLNDVLLNISDV